MANFVRILLSMSLLIRLYSCIKCVSGPYTELHKRISPLFLFWYKNALFTNKLWEFVVRFSHSTAVTNIVYIISELQEHASSYCCDTQRALFTNKIIRLVPNHLTLPVYKVLCTYVFSSY